MYTYVYNMDPMYMKCSGTVKTTEECTCIHAYVKNHIEAK